MALYALAQTSIDDATDAGRELGSEIDVAMGGESADAVIVFASARYDHRALLQALDQVCAPSAMIGCSSAGEFTKGEHETGSACAVAIRADDIAFKATYASGLRGDWRGGAGRLIAGFEGLRSYEHPYHSALILTDALAGHVNEMVGELARLTSGRYQFFGGGACDDARFEETPVFFGTEVMVDTVVALEMRSSRPIGLGVQHGWEPVGRGMRVTEAEGRRLIGIDGAPAVEVFQEHGEASGQPFDATDPIPFFLHNVLGIDTGAGHRLSVPLAVDEDGSLLCAAEVPEGSLVHIMRSSEQCAAAAATAAARDAVAGLGDAKPGLVLVFDCVATRLRLGQGFDAELQGVQEAVGAARMIGCNTNGQVARGDRQFNGFHNCTAVIAALPA